MPVSTISWSGGIDGVARIIDQTLLPTEFKVIEIADAESMWEAIRVLRVRGAPAIGIAAAMGVVLGLKQRAATTAAELVADVNRVADYLATSRPTAVNLFWALDRMRAVAREALEEGGGAAPTRGSRGPENGVRPQRKDIKGTDSIFRPPAAVALRERLLAEALAILEEDRDRCRQIGRHGAALVPRGGGVLTHCNAGGLATADYGTALAVLFAAHEAGVPFRVFADETRPLLQGARLTTWELMQAGIDVTLLCDSMAAQVMREGKVQAVIVGADRIAANGDTANKIGTYGVAVLARAHGIPFYVAAPTSTFDLSLPTGAAIPIEERSAEEVTQGFGRRTAPEGVKVYNPAFDVTPAEFIAAIVTEKGVIAHPNAERIREHLRSDPQIHTN
jgi:methylthioribose-1-phosphate isomerase